MFRIHRLYAISLSAAFILIGGFFALRSQSTGRRSAPLIRAAIDENKLVTLSGNTRPEANAQNDVGPVGDSYALDHMQLQLKRSPEEEQAAKKFIDDLHNPKSPNFHKWMTAEEFGKQFGLAESDIQTITVWLESHGFKVNSVYPSGMVIDFSGTAGSVQSAFHTSIHHLIVNGVDHIANMSDPQVPQALAPAIAGVISMHNFMPHKMARPKYTVVSQGGTYYPLVPADLATIYDFNPLFNATSPIVGQGQTIAVVEDSDLYNPADWTNFRKAFGLSTFSSGSLTTVHPSGTGANNCQDPGVNGDDSEATLDAEWASAAAPGAAIVVAACADTNVSFGVTVAIQNLLNETNPPSIISVSYGGCEAENGAAGNAAVNSLFQQGVAEGVSIFVSAGDAGPAECDDLSVPPPYAAHGIAVSAFASTPYNVAVGGTDFADVLNNATSTYWSNTNSATYGSATKYIPEIPWNDSCANSLFAKYNGYPTVYGASGYCNSASAINNGYVLVGGGGGGPSNCATGSPASFGVANGSCQGYSKPSWQAGPSGIPGDGVRDLPDVAMFASDGAMWSHYAVVCFSDPESGYPCRGAPANWAGYGGTSLSSPVMAGVQALINQKQGSAQGNPNYVYYAMAVSAPSAFHTVTQGDIDQSCNGLFNCYGILGTIDYGRGGRIYGTTWAGALSTSSSSFTPAYGTGSAQWNFATGLGSVDVNNLVMKWTPQ